MIAVRLTTLASNRRSRSDALMKGSPQNRRPNRHRLVRPDPTTATVLPRGSFHLVAKRAPRVKAYGPDLARCGPFRRFAPLRPAGVRAALAAGAAGLRGSLSGADL